MNQEERMSDPPWLLSQYERSFYFEQEYLVKESAIGPEWLDQLNLATTALVKSTRLMSRSTQTYDLQVGHSADNLRHRRIASLDDLDPIFGIFARIQRSPIWLLTCLVQLFDFGNA